MSLQCLSILCCAIKSDVVRALDFNNVVAASAQNPASKKYKEKTLTA